MKIERYVAGKRVTLDQIKKYTIKNKAVDMAVEKVIKRESKI